MAINFPDSPTVGATYTVGKVTWEWNGTTWTSLGSDAAAELALKAPKDSPTFTGTVTTPLTTAGYVKTSAGGALSSSAAIAQADVTNLTTDLAGKAATSHTHTQSQVTNLTTDLANKAALAGAAFTGNVSVGGNFKWVAPYGAGNITSRLDNGNYENSVATVADGWPAPAASDWWHLSSNTHSNTSNYYASQFAASFFDSGKLYYRSTSGSGTTAWNKVFHSGNANVIVDISGNYTITAQNAYQTIRSTGGALTVFIANVLSVGQRVDFIQYGSGQINFAASGVTLNYPGTKNKTNAQYSAATVICVASGVYCLIGDIA